MNGIVDSMWLTKPGTPLEDFRRIAMEMGSELELPIGLEGRYRWIVFLDSKLDSRTPVLNRYYGLLEDGTFKVRGIELRRHDTPKIVSNCQEEMLGALSKAKNSSEFSALIPDALSVLRNYGELVREGHVPLKELLIEKNLSKAPEEYSNLIPQAIAARRLVREGGTIHAGQSLEFVLANDRKAVAKELVDENTVYDVEEYRKLLVASAENLLLPFGYSRDRLRKLWTKNTVARSNTPQTQHQPFLSRSCPLSCQRQNLAPRTS